MITRNGIWIAQSKAPLVLLPQMANRHGLIAGATGTGKTVTVKVLAESFSSLGVPVFLSDVKGDLSGMCQEGEILENTKKRIRNLNIPEWEFISFPSCYWDIFGEVGHPVRATISDMGPVLLSKLLELTEVQSGVLSIVFRIADDNSLLLIDMKDLRLMLQYVGDHRSEYTLRYGNISAQSIGAIQRALLKLEDDGGNIFFGEPSLDITDWIRTDRYGRGYINILNSTRLIQNPNLYATFLLWMLSDLYEKLPEVGDLEQPRIVFFFDEAHLLFNNAPKVLLQKIIQIVKLVRSKGVGLYFISQSPSDIPDEVLAQLSNRVQHALRAYTPSEMKAVKIAAQAFRKNPEFDTEEVITQLGVGEALISLLDEEGIPNIVQKATILPPQSKLGPGDARIIKKAILSSEFEEKYRDSIDRRSAYEILEEEMEEEQEEMNAKKTEKKPVKKASKKATPIEKAVNSATSSVSRSIGGNIAKTFTGGKKVSTSKMVERAATNALSTFFREGTKSITRGLFGTKK